MSKNSFNVSRRRLVLGALQGAGILFLSGCEKMFNDLQENQKFLSLLESAEGLTQSVQRFLTGRNKLAKEFTERDISRTFKANGNPPPMTEDYVADAEKGWVAWRLEVSGLVKQPMQFSLSDLRALPSRSQITRHDCVEGWSAIAKWKGVELAEIVGRAEPRPEARYVVFHCMDTDSDGSHYYESIDWVDANHPQTILAYEMNDRALPIEHGAPIRLRVETQLGYKHAKYIRKIELVSSFKHIQKGKGGYWEDQGYEWYAGI
jgi:DMSO/TMAO reductase YedYZ molybdopterin-dependent catalytic subunit